MATLKALQTENKSVDRSETLTVEIVVVQMVAGKVHLSVRKKVLILAVMWVERMDAAWEYSLGAFSVAQKELLMVYTKVEM